MSEHPCGPRCAPSVLLQGPANEQKSALVAAKPCLYQERPTCSNRSAPFTALSRNRLPLITGCWLVLAIQTTPRSPMLQESVPIEYAVIEPTVPALEMSNTSPTITSG